MPVCIGVNYLYSERKKKKTLIAIEKSMPLNQSRNMPVTITAREEKYEGRKKLRIPLNSGKPKPRPLSAIANMPEWYGIQKKKRKTHMYNERKKKKSASEMMDI